MLVSTLPVRQAQIVLINNFSIYYHHKHKPYILFNVLKTCVYTNSTTAGATNNSELTPAPQFHRLSQQLQSNFNHQPLSDDTAHPDTETVGEEVLPSTLGAAYDVRLRAVFAIQHDHTYAIPIQPSITPTLSGSHQIPQPQQPPTQQQQMRSVAGQSIAIAALSHNEVVAPPASISYQQQQQQQQLAAGTAASTSAGITPNHIYNASHVVPLPHLQSTITGGPVQKNLANAGGFNFVFPKSTGK